MTAILVFSRTTGYRHDSIPAGVQAIRELGAELGHAVHATEDPAAFTADELAEIGAVVFVSTSGELFDDAQRQALRAYLLGGGAYVGVHAASTTEYDWPFYGDVVGARFDGHPRIQPATVRVEDPDHPAVGHWPETFEWTDEWYNFRSQPAAGSRVVLSVDEGSYDGGTMGHSHPIAWARRVGHGRAFYTALGHGSEHYADRDFRAHLSGALESVVR